MTSGILERIADGRTDLIFDYLAQGHPAKSADRGGTALINWCAYYGDVSGIDIDAATPGTLQVVRTELLDYLRGQKVRPAVIDGETVKREDVKLRYYYSY